MREGRKSVRENGCKNEEIKESKKDRAIKKFREEKRMVEWRK